MFVPFIISSPGRPKISVVEHRSSTSDEDVTSLICRVEQVLPPITITWLMDDVMVKNTLFSETDNHEVVTTYNFNINRDVQKVGCKVNGTFIKSASTVYEPYGKYIFLLNMLSC